MLWKARNASTASGALEDAGRADSDAFTSQVAPRVLEDATASVRRSVASRRGLNLEDAAQVNAIQPGKDELEDAFATMWHRDVLNPGKIQTLKAVVLSANASRGNVSFDFLEPTTLEKSSVGQG